MRELFENGKITEVRVGDYMITLAKNGCFQVREIKTGFLNLESSSIATYEWVSKWCRDVQGL